MPDNQVSEQKAKFILNNQIRTLLSEINRDDSWKNIDGVTKLAVKLQELSVVIFSEEDISPFLMSFDDSSLTIPYTSAVFRVYAEKRIVEIRMSMTMLHAFITTKLGDPTAQEFIADGLSEASKVLNDDGQAHRILLASLLIRIPIEQTLKTLCNLNNIQYSRTALAGHLNQKLFDNKIYPVHVKSEVDASLQFLGAVIHNNTNLPEGKVRETLDWARQFISSYLPGLPGD